MINTLEIAKELHAAGLDQPAAEAIASSILKAHQEDPPVSRLYVDAKVADLRTEFYRVVGAQTLTLMVAILGGVYWIVSHVHAP